MNSTSNHIVITRHPALVEYLIGEGIILPNTPVIEHATVEDVTGRHVIGVLPHYLSCLTKTYTEVSMNLPQELRGKELTLEEIETYTTNINTYIIHLQTTRDQS